MPGLCVGAGENLPSCFQSENCTNWVSSIHKRFKQLYWYLYRFFNCCVILLFKSKYFQNKPSSAWDKLSNTGYMSSCDKGQASSSGTLVSAFTLNPTGSKNSVGLFDIKYDLWEKSGILWVGFSVSVSISVLTAAYDRNAASHAKN